MKNRSSVSGHWTDEQLIAQLYGVGPADSHLEGCSECRGRLAAMETSRSATESFAQDGVSTELLSAQRKALYAKLEKRRGWRLVLPAHKWVPAACALIVTGGGLAVWEHQVAWEQSAQEQIARAQTSDAKLADDVSRVADSPEPEAAAPLRGLFED